MLVPTKGWFRRTAEVSSGGRLRPELPPKPTLTATGLGLPRWVERSHGHLARDRCSLRVRLQAHPPDAGCWCSRNKWQPYVSLIWCSAPSGHGNGLRLWIRTSDRRTAHEPVKLTLDFEHARVSSHSMTSSARTRIDGGTVRPSVLAVSRLMTSSKVVGCWTGRSAGFAP